MSAALLVLSFCSTKLLGLDRTVRLATALGRRCRPLWRAFGIRPAPQIADRVQRGLRFLPFPIECLDQAIVTWYLLNLRGHAANLRVGMKLSPVSGHAWVVNGGQTFVATPGLEDFTVVAEYPAWR